jgi:23S rRNA (adenine2503-C2)-methyltransferase
LRAREFIPDVEKALRSRGEPGYRVGQAYGALCGGLVRDWEEVTALP